ncbi:hypothetical protein ACFVYA_38230 [Amycolatopsis sp. NPDC058278]|uniref:hypothetical protein n=1 Tax=Amycolatopsis sp. NPDC058278 TaxID=3346417 RepID=UPI0036D82B9C
MLRSRWSRAAGYAAPGLVLAGSGLAHPLALSPASAPWWTTLHVVLLPVFPLLAVAQWLLLSSAPAALRRPGRLAAFGFAAFYGGLDAVAGIAAGTVVHAEHAVTPVTGAVFGIGDSLGHTGALCFLAANVLIVAAFAREAAWRAAPGAVLLLTASVSFYDSHIFWPRGVLTMLAVAAGMFLLAASREPLPERTSGLPAG